MTTMILSGLKRSQGIEMQKIAVTDVSNTKIEKLKAEFGVMGWTHNEQLVDQCQVIVLAVKPDQVTEVLEPLRSSLTDKHIVLSLAAGISLQTLKNAAAGARVARIMPNTPISVGRGVVGFYAESTDSSLLAITEDLFSSVAKVVPLQDESQLDILTVACGSGPGFVFELMQIWQEWLEQFDFDEDSSRSLVIQTFLGSSKLALESGDTFYALQDKVTSKKGVTEQGLLAMRDGNLDGVLRVGFEKAMMRTQALKKEKF